MKIRDGQTVYEMPQGIINWYDFRPCSMALLVYRENSSLLELLQRKNLIVTCASVEEIMSNEFTKRFARSFDYVIAVNILEICRTPETFLSSLREVVSTEGILLLGTDNRLGIRYFCGDKDPYTCRFFDGVEGYRRQDAKQRENRSGRCYAKAEILDFLETSGWKKYKNYSVFPDLYAPQLIFAEGYEIKEELSIRCFPKYNAPETVFVKEEFLYSDLIKNHLFEEMANAFLFECTLSGELSRVCQVTLSMDRGHRDCFATVVYGDGHVRKKALYEEGGPKLDGMQENMRCLRERGIAVVDGRIEGDCYVMPRVDAPLGNVYLYRLLESDPELFIREMDHFRGLILRSSDEIDAEYDRNKMGPVLRKGYLDMVPLNSFYRNGEFVFFDQEFVAEQYPANAIIYRSIAIVYEDDPRRKAIIPEEFFWKRYGMEGQISQLREMTAQFNQTLRRQDELASYNKRRCRNEKMMHENRFRMDFAERDFEKLFYNPLSGLEERKLFLFGAGRYAEKFIAMYHRDYTIEAILDNDVKKWNGRLEGYPIQSPDVLYTLPADCYKVVICMKAYQDVLWQLQQIGAVNISIYQKDRVYPGRQACVLYQEERDSNIHKRYHIGYIAGVFDLYHIGHLNMFRRAKEQCDYLIVGVVTDDGVQEFKKKEVFVPFEERVEMVRSCRYVDEVVEIPFFFRTTIEAFEKYHFDVQFSGSDYEDDPGWLEHKRYLESHGAAMVFFPYTQQTSSTKIKALIDKGLV